MKRLFLNKFYDAGTGAKSSNGSGDDAKANAKKAQAKLNSEANKIASDNGVNIVYLNSKEEWFTNENLALLSDKKDNIKTFDFTKKDSPKKSSESEEE